MSETNKVILAAVLGILVGFGGGRLLENRATPSVDESDTTVNTEETVEAKDDLVKTGDETTIKDDTTATDVATDVKKEDVKIVPVVKTIPIVTSLVSTSVVTVKDQAAGTLVKADATMDRIGWVVVRDDKGGKVGNILGARRHPIGAGNVDVLLLRATVAYSSYFVTLMNDDGDGKFDYKKDLQLTDSKGAPIMVSFRATK